ncbi:MAG: tRNA1(Val) (adenine(37)-N6)-methyltransferase [Peptostreptococcaceae bacterium]|jgi:ribosomal protein L11 methyltransferase (prmA)|nr:tRNA1(Val) (adenine(37)-N6)-methyltransferase [Peptostreptococcaceae bacterium]
MILEDEIVDDLQIKDYKIIQKKNGFKFGIDSVLLTNFVKYKKNAKIADLGTGTAIIPILLCAKADIEKIYAIEIQETIANMAKRSVDMNNLNEKIEVLNINLKDASEYLEKNSLDIITTNPPYMPNSKLLSSNDMMMISRNEIYCTVADIMGVSSKLLKSNAKLYMVHRPSRLSDIIVEGRKNSLELKQMRMVHPSVNKSANMVLLQFTKNAKPEIKIQEPLYIHNNDGSYTEEVKQIYAKKKLDI